jgi:hypothetical protein
MDSNETREDKVEKPHAHFGDPQNVVADPALSKEEKVEALETLEHDARLLTTAAQEGMTGGEENKLQEGDCSPPCWAQPGRMTGSPASAARSAARAVSRCRRPVAMTLAAAA